MPATGQDLFADPEAIRHRTAWDRGGKRVGVLEDVYVDDLSGRAMWATVRLDAPAPDAPDTPDGAEARRSPGETFVPLAGAAPRPSGGLALPCSADAVATAPLMAAEQHLDLDQEQELYLHYGLTPPEEEASGAPGVGPARPKAPVTEGEEDLSGIRELSDEPGPEPERVPRLRRYEPGEENGGKAGRGGEGNAAAGATRVENG